MNSIEKMTGGEAMIRAAIANGIDTIFGLPGAQIYPMFDAIHQSPDVTAVISRHEQGAAYMAFGYASATGRPGAFAVVPGPGVLNTTAALCTAAGCNKPVLCLTGQIPSDFLGVGRGHLHELSDQQGTLQSIIKYTDHIDAPGKTFSRMNDAFRNMVSGRPGPASVEMCWDTMAQEWDVDVLPGNDVVETPVIDEDAIADAARLVKGARKIMIMCGNGAQHASEQVTELARLLGASVTAFRSGRGVVGEDTAWGVSSVAGHLLMQDTDLLIGIGSRMEMPYMRWLSMNKYHDKPPAGGPALIRIDIDPQEMQRLKPDVAIVADAAEGTRALIEKVSTSGCKAGDLERIAAAKASAAKSITEIQPQIDYLDTIRAVLPRDGYLVEELCQVGFASYFGFAVYEPRTYVTSGYQGTLGFGFPTAIGVKVARPDKAVVSITGDGGFMYGMPELASAVQQKIGLVTVVFNNNSFGNVRRDQQERYDSNLIGADLDNPDFARLAESFGAAGYRVTNPTELKPVLEKAIDDDKPAVIDVIVERGSETSPWKYIHRF